MRYWVLVVEGNRSSSYEITAGDSERKFDGKVFDIAGENIGEKGYSDESDQLHSATLPRTSL